MQPDAETFSVLPPHFNSNEVYVVSAIHKLYSCSSLNPIFFGVLNKCLASIVHHSDMFKTTLGISHVIMQSLLFRDSSMLTTLKQALNDNAYESSIMVPTGIPPHVTILREIKKIKHQSKRGY